MAGCERFRPNELSFRENYPKTADVVIIGGGMVGPAAAWALEKASPGIKTVVIEKNSQLASGASSASIENFRSCWPTESIAEMMKRSIDVFTHADDYFGEGAQESLKVKQRGYLYLAFNEDQATELKRTVAHVNALGLNHIEFLTDNDLCYRYPFLKGQVYAGMFDPKAGWLDSNSLAYLYVKSASGTNIVYGESESRIVVEDGKVVGVSTSQGFIHTKNAIIAAGADSRAVGKTAGINLPIIVRPRQSFTSPFRHCQLPENSPFLIGSYPHPYVRPEGTAGTIFGWEYNWNTKHIFPEAPVSNHLIEPVWPISKVMDQRFPSITLSLLAKQFNHLPGEGFADPNYLRGIRQQAGYYVYRDATAAHHQVNGDCVPYTSQRAIIDACPGIDGLYLSIAHVGHGVMASPAAGEIVASYIVKDNLPQPIFQHFQLNVTSVPYDGGGL